MPNGCGGVSNPIRFKTIDEARKVSPKAVFFQGQQISQVFALEIFAGTARLTACLRSLGLVDSVGIDCTMPTCLNGPIIKLDLLQPSHLQLVKDLIANRACVYVHFAPPCGTASRARLIQNSDKYMPPSLRFDDYPNGCRVNKANELYIASPLSSSFFAKKIISCGHVKTQADHLCGKPFLFNSCFPPLSACPPKCTIVCSGRPAES